MKEKTPQDEAPIKESSSDEKGDKVNDVVDAQEKKSAKPKHPKLRAGQTVRVHLRIQEGEKERIQIFEGIILTAKHGAGINGTITVRKISEGIGVEKIFPLASPLIEKIEVRKNSKTRQATLYHLREAKARRLKITN